MNELLVLSGMALSLTAIGSYERFTHNKAVRRIPLRIHVNGTRGKSSVTRLIAAGLRGANKRTVAKTTGTLARLILPNGRELPIYRKGRPNIIEQLGVIREAVEQRAEALVVECMALQPTLQSLSERLMIKANYGVITNARADHLDVMGPTEKDVARALAGSTPVQGVLFTTQGPFLNVFEQAAKDRGTRLIVTNDEDLNGVTDGDLKGFKYLEHRENLALVLRVLKELNIPKEQALPAMWHAEPDPGALTETVVDFFGRQLIFVNAFAANDPESTERIFRNTLETHPSAERTLAVINCRADRPDRSRQMGEAMSTWPLVDHYLVIGSGTYLFAKAAIQGVRVRGEDNRVVHHAIDPSRLVLAEDESIAQIFEHIVELLGRNGLAIGVANIGGPGLELTQFFKNRARLGGGK